MRRVAVSFFSDDINAVPFIFFLPFFIQHFPARWFLCVVCAVCLCVGVYMRVCVCVSAYLCLCVSVPFLFLFFVLFSVFLFVYVA